LQNRILKVDPTGIITTVAGGGFSFSDGIPAKTAAILPTGFGLDSAGNLYLSDFFTYSVRKVDTAGTITTIAGTGKSGFSGDGGPALQAAFSFGADGSIAVDSSGNILVADDGNGRIRKLDASQKVNTVAGNGLFHFSGDGGLATSATLDTPTGLAGDRAGNIYFTEPFLSRIRRIAPDGTISVLAGTGVPGYSGDGGPALSANIGYPGYLAVAADGSVVFSDELNCVIRSINTTGVIRTIAGSVDDCGILKEPQGVDFDPGGNLAIAD
jgi:sugar lactone lactonase YvrE